VGVFPPFPYLRDVASELRHLNSPIFVGAQDFYPAANGAFTGEVSIALVAPHCDYILAGHSERRHTIGHHEDDRMINLKVRASRAAGLIHQQARVLERHIGRPFDPLGECKTRDDYRTRYAQYHGDLDVLVGLRLDIPLGRHVGEVRHAIQQRSVSRARLAERAILARIESEVRTAVAGLAVSVQLVQAADHTVELSEKLLEGMRKRFRAGASTSFDVLRVSEALAQARIEAARARADYQGNQTRLATATGTLLDSAGITIDSLGAPPR
jgi:hypothetical protein